MVNNGIGCRNGSNAMRDNEVTCGTVPHKPVNSNQLLLELCTNTQTQTQIALHIWRECYKPIVIVEKTCIW